MAQPHDIEDVLSSIRRLVANDGGAGVVGSAATGAKPDPEIETAEDVESDALVLDPAHRVTDPEDPFQMIRSLAQEERDGRDAEFVLASVEEEVTSITTDIVAEVVSSDLSWSEEAPVPEDYKEDTDYQAATQDDDSANMDDISAAVAEVTQPDIEDATLIPDDVSETVADPDAAEHGYAPEALSDSEMAAEVEDAPEEIEPIISKDDEQQAWDLDAEAASDEADANGDNADSDGWQADPEPIAEVAPPVEEQPAETKSETEEEQLSDLSDLSEAVGNDDALRELIAEIVRQELSGALGERITRNVRKLVRREIRQMLSSGEFD